METSHTITMSMSYLTKHTVTKTSQIQGHLLILLLEFCLHTHCSLPCLEHTQTYIHTHNLSLSCSLSLSFFFFLSLNEGAGCKKANTLIYYACAFLFICCYFVFCFVVCCCCCWKWNRQSYHSFFRTPACSYSID